ncbi:Retrovirus-related Pol polyprotein from type-1 retrotransposable element R1 2 [Eumeta japonica]|uniref:Retrovirus-related Pol polyprotein from type-1 retrotransposable element R1 2 n=1 Tax=Eumeta variegata TaxID=151549 RepID=A0A4C1TUD0_EUMVA|nr:Retrovirus-related Pol polyprotein from type-1 retrotransposable element R1 2 [Eumeta japonica]
MLSRLMANIGGPTQSKRRLIMETVNSILLYGSEIWGDALVAKTRRKVLESVQRTAALRVASAYRTVSGAAVLVISGVVPVDLLALERKEAWELKKQNVNFCATELRSPTIQRWNRWQIEDYGTWTKKLISNIEDWIKKKFGETNYFLTQFLAGHGYFRKYLHRMGKINDPSCIYCDCINDDAEHTFFNCVRWQADMNSLRSQIGHFTTTNIIEKMLESERNWNKVKEYVERILRLKKADLDRVQRDEENGGPRRG